MMLSYLNCNLSLLSLIASVFAGVEDTGTSLSLQLNISITSRTGTNLSTDVSVLHQHYDASALQKRYISRKVDRCPKGDYANWNFVESSCTNDLNARNYTVWCSPPNTHKANSTITSLSGQCNAEELCISSRKRAADAPELVNSGTAFCVGIANFVAIAQTQLSEPEFAQIVSLENASTVASSMSVVAEAVLTDKTNTTTLQAAGMLIAPNPFTSSTDFTMAIARAALDASAICVNCSSVLVGPLPAGTMQLNAEVVLEPNTSGNLFLVTLSL